MMKRAVGGGSAALMLALTGLVGTASIAGAADAAGTGAAPPAPDAPAAPACPSDHACVYDAAGNILYQSAGDTGTISIPAPAGGATVWNNGEHWPGADHIQLYTYYGTTRWTICLHNGPRPSVEQPYPTAARIIEGESVAGWSWRGECVGDEDEWHPG